MSQINPGSLFGEYFGFTEDKFSDDSYLWKTGSTIYISLIFSKHPGEGNFSALIRAIESGGYRVGIPTPLGRMIDVLIHLGFRRYLSGGAEIWGR